MPFQFDRLRSGAVFVIAEIGVNHCGRLDLARQMIEAAKAAGADAVKFQTFRAETLATPATPKVAYQRRTAPRQSHYEMLRSLELSFEAQAELFQFCRTASIDFLSTPYDIESAAFLDTLGVDAFKVASADIIDAPLHAFLAGTEKPVIASTGMATLEEIAGAVETYRKSGPERLALMHCVSNYPCSDTSLNLRVIDTLRASFSLPVGFSDHSEGPEASVAAVALGAIIIEKHFTIDRGLPGPDQMASTEPAEFAQLVRAVRRAEQMLGSPLKRCQAEEQEMARVSRKSVSLSRAIAAGTVLTEDVLATRRPGSGLPPATLTQLVGRRVRRDLPQFHLLCLEDLD